MKKSDPGVELEKGDYVISAVPCGVVSVIVTAIATEAATIKLYDVVATADIAAATAIKTLSCGGTAGIAVSVVYCPCKSDSFAKGCCAVVSGGNDALAYVSIES